MSLNQVKTFLKPDDATYYTKLLIFFFLKFVTLFFHYLFLTFYIFYTYIYIYTTYIPHHHLMDEHSTRGSRGDGVPNQRELVLWQLP